MTKTLTISKSGDVKALKRSTPIRVKNQRDACRALIRVAQGIVRNTPRNIFGAAAVLEVCEPLLAAAEAVGGPRCQEEVTFACLPAGREKRREARDAGPFRRARRAASGFHPFMGLKKQV